jgi:hypothetical protein
MYVGWNVDPVTTEPKGKASETPAGMFRGNTPTLANPTETMPRSQSRLTLPSGARRRYSLHHAKSWTNVRCRLIASWGWRRSQGFGCSPMKAVRELGLDRRETGRSLSAAGAGYLRGFLPSTRGLEGTYRWCSSCHASGTAG